MLLLPAQPRRLRSRGESLVPRRGSLLASRLPVHAATPSRVCSCVGCEQSVVVCPAAGLGAVGHLELAVDVGQVKFDRLFGHPQLLCELPVGAPVGDKSEDLEFASCQFMGGRLGLGRRKGGYSPLERFARDVDRPLEGLPDRICQLLGLLLSSCSRPTPRPRTARSDSRQSVGVRDDYRLQPRWWASLARRIHAHLVGVRLRRAPRSRRSGGVLPD